MSTIVAISTAPGIGGIGIIRMSGEETYSILQKIFQPKHETNLTEVRGYTIKYGFIIENKIVIDEVLVSFFKSPNSYTTEDLCEINSHGGNFIVKKILELCLENGATLAEPGEFTKRAFLNGRIDLAQAEAVIDVILAKTQKASKASMKQLEGGLSEEIQKIRDMLMSIMVEVEVSIDYPEYDVEEVSNQKAELILKQVKNELEKLKNSFETGKMIKEGIKIALIGKPNAGKSSLLNTILKEERAIVTEIEGTTRDIIQESISIKGIPINIIDTAGIRDADNKVEQIGIERSRKSAEEADLIIAIFDASREFTKEDREIIEMLQNKKSIIVLNKIDIAKNDVKQELLKIILPENIIEISIKNKQGIHKIYDRIEQLFQLDEIQVDYETTITNVRHKDIITKAIQITDKAIQTNKQNMPIDITGLEIKEIMEELGKITGESVNDEIIKEIFSKFCLGK
ncbi:MAG: tRNA uridine-5-carboxymethylaminomethyl(34) synthesis GTPase MnmE [Clostridia bacterium]|nr:tRNA uridine-5-carboxymethylaminomethyl(34) synthesis GTPase MnmE [Clostridia bacterium]